MSVHEIFAAFVVNRPESGRHPVEWDQGPMEWVGERAGRAGLALRVASTGSAEPAGDEAPVDIDAMPYGAGALPYMEGDWLGLPVELRLVEGEDFRALVVVMGQSAFIRRVVRSGDTFLEHVVSAFRDACDAVAPTYAYVVTAPEEDIPGHLKRVSVDVYGRDGQALTDLGLPLIYVDRDFGAPRPEGPSVRVSAERGVVLAAGESLSGWL